MVHLLMVIGSLITFRLDKDYDYMNIKIFLSTNMMPSRQNLVSFCSMKGNEANENREDVEAQLLE